MVTSIKQDRNASSNSAKNTLPTDEKSVTKLAAERNEVAIKSRNDSFEDLRKAAAASLFLGVVYGRFERFNDLFNRLTPTDAGAMRNLFVAKVVETYGHGGVRAKLEDGTDSTAWIVRPKAFVTYTAKPEKEGNHFALSKSETESVKALIDAGKESVKKAGIEGLESIVWQKRQDMLKVAVDYDRNALHKDLLRILKKAAPMAGLEGSGLAVSTIDSIMRDAAFLKSDIAVIRAMYPERAKTPTESSNDSSESKSEAA